MKNAIQKIISCQGLAVIALVLCTGFLFSCSKDKESVTPGSQSHKIVFKAKTSSGCNLNSVAYGTDDNIISGSSLSGTSWQSEEITAPAGTGV